MTTPLQTPATMPDASADAPAGARVVETVEFATRPDVSPGAVLAALDALVPDLREIDGFVRQAVYAVSDAEPQAEPATRTQRWLLLYEWETVEDAKRSTERMLGRASFAHLLGLVADPAAIRMTVGEPRADTRDSRPHAA